MGQWGHEGEGVGADKSIFYSRWGDLKTCNIWNLWKKEDYLLILVFLNISLIYFRHYIWFQVTDRAVYMLQVIAKMKTRLGKQYLQEHRHRHRPFQRRYGYTLLFQLFMNHESTNEFLDQIMQRKYVYRLTMHPMIWWNKISETYATITATWIRKKALSVERLHLSRIKTWEYLIVCPN